MSSTELSLLTNSKIWLSTAIPTFVINYIFVAVKESKLQSMIKCRENKIMSWTAIANHHAWSFCENPLKIQEIKHAVDEFIEAKLSVHRNKY